MEPDRSLYLEVSTTFRSRGAKLKHVGLSPECDFTFYGEVRHPVLTPVVH